MAENRSAVARDGRVRVGQKEGIAKGQEETFAEHRCVHFLDYGDDFIGYINVKIY